MATLKRKSQSLENDYLDSSGDENDKNNEGNDGEEGTEIKLKLNKKKGQQGDDDEGLKLKKKEGKKRVKVENERLIGVDGLRRVYEEFPQICEFKGRGTEAKYLSNLIDRYKEWSFQLYPSFEYSQVLSRTRTISITEAPTKNLLEELRRQECDRRMREVYNVEIPEDAYIFDDEADEVTGPSSSLSDPSADNTTLNSGSNGANPGTGASAGGGGGAGAGGTAVTLSDDMFMQAMMMYEKAASTSNGAAGGGTDEGTGTDTGAGAGVGAVAVALSDSEDDDEEEEFEVVSSSSSPRKDEESTSGSQDQDKEAQEEKNKDDSEEDGDVLGDLLAMDSVA